MRSFCLPQTLFTQHLRGGARSGRDIDFLQPLLSPGVRASRYMIAAAPATRLSDADKSALINRDDLTADMRRGIGKQEQAGPRDILGRSHFVGGFAE